MKLRKCICGNILINPNMDACSDLCEQEMHNNEGVIPDSLYEMLWDIDEAEIEIQEDDEEFKDYFQDLREDLHDN